MRILFSSLALSTCAFRNYAVDAHRGNLVPVFMLSVKALAESDGHPPILFGPRDPCEEYAHLDQTIQCMAYARGRGTKWRDEFKACHTCVFWRLAAMKDDLTYQRRSDLTCSDPHRGRPRRGADVLDWILGFGLIISLAAVFHSVRSLSHDDYRQFIAALSTCMRFYLFVVPVGIVVYQIGFRGYCDEDPGGAVVLDGACYLARVISNIST